MVFTEGSAQPCHLVESDLLSPLSQTSFFLCLVRNLSSIFCNILVLDLLIENPAMTIFRIQVIPGIVISITSDYIPLYFV